MSAWSWSWSLEVLAWGVRFVTHPMLEVDGPPRQARPLIGAGSYLVYFPDWRHLPCHWWYLAWVVTTFLLNYLPNLHQNLYHVCLYLIILSCAAFLPFFDIIGGGIHVIFGGPPVFWYHRGSGVILGGQGGGRAYILTESEISWILMNTISWILMSTIYCHGPG